MAPGKVKCILMKSVVVPALSAVLLPMTSGNASAGPEDSLCVHFAGTSKGIHVSLKSGFSMNGTLPVTFCGLGSDSDWKLEVDGKGLEKRRGVFGLDETGNPFIKGRRLSAAFKNALLPGWGTISEGDRAEGWTDMASIAASALYLYHADSEYRDMKDKYDDLLEALDRAETLEEEARIRDAAHSASVSLNTQNLHRKRILWAGAALYGMQILDPLLFGGPPGWESQAGGSVLQIRRAGSSRMKAFALSMLKPGRGQFYQGKKTRGIIYSAMTAAAGYYALDRMNKYDEDADRYEIGIEKFEAAVSVEDKNYYKQRAEELWDDLKDSKRERNIALGCLAGSWIINLVDTFMSPGGGDGSSNLTFETAPTGGALVYRF